MTVVAITPPGGTELLVILLIFVLLFGARKLPELGSSVGRTIKNFKKGVAEAEADEDTSAQPDPDSSTPAARDGR
jgi:sec-independent protein translocase protein TatA